MSTWHAPPDLLDRYVRRPEAIDDTTASSIEQHLLACADCRAAVSAAAPVDELEASWGRVADVIDRPTPSVLERLLRRVGLASDSARLVGATGALQLGWLLVVIGLTAAALMASDTKASTGPFLLVAPLLPLAAVALAFLPLYDPAGEAGVATPMHGLGVAVRRVLATTAPTMLVLGLAAPLLPDGRGSSVAWLLPALALASVSLLLSTVVRVPVAVGATSVAWIVALAVARVAQRGVPVQNSVAFGATSQVLALTVTAVALVGVALRRDRFATLEVTW